MLSADVPADSASTVMRMLECHRCGAEIESVEFHNAGWLCLHVWSDGATVNVCPSCQSDVERDEVGNSEAA
jgi:hypothetical protein